MCIFYQLLDSAVYETQNPSIILQNNEKLKNYGKNLWKTHLRFKQVLMNWHFYYLFFLHKVEHIFKLIIVALECWALFVRNINSLLILECIKLTFIWRILKKDVEKNLRKFHEIKKKENEIPKWKKNVFQHFYSGIKRSHGIISSNKKWFSVAGMIDESQQSILVIFSLSVFSSTLKSNHNFIFS